MNPIEIISTRPVQKTFPNVNGLYLLLRSMGMLRLMQSKTQTVITINEALLKNWNTLNETEQYFSLLETWFLHSSPREVIESGNEIVLLSVSRFFHLSSAHSLAKTLEITTYASELYSLALFEMFGFITIEAETPLKKNYWNITDITVKPLAKKILPLILPTKNEQELYLFSISKKGSYQTEIFPYCKTYKNTLIFPYQEPIVGTYRLKISLQKAYRVIEISSNSSFDFLADAILEQFDFDNDHLYMFKYLNNFGVTMSIIEGSIANDNDEKFADECQLNTLSFQALDRFKFIFDFGDDWEFDILIESIDNTQEVKNINLLKSHGKAPEQYPEYNEELW